MTGASSIVAYSDGDRVIALYNIHTGETASILYKRAGKYVPSGLERVNWMLRDWRRNETTKMDPELVDLLWEIHTELGSKEPIHIISGYRSRSTNEMLRKTVGGQASQSRHILGKAADVHFPDIPVKNLRYSALIRERGGVGYYPTSAIPFVHIDTGRVRAWPRLPRYELALLFPQGHTRHSPADGVPLTEDDVRAARAQHRDLATQIAQLRRWLDQPKAPYAVAEATGDRDAQSKPQVAPLAPPRPIALAQRPQLVAETRLPSATAPSASEREQLTQLAALASLQPKLVSGPVPVSRRNRTLASLTGDPIPSIASLIARDAQENASPIPGSRLAALHPGGEADLGGSSRRFGWGTGWVSAPAYDEEHPEELSYRPFPVGPLLTASANESVFGELVHHDVARTLDMLDQPGTVLPLRFRPREKTAQLLWAQEFRGDPIGLAKLLDASDPAPAQLQNRPVRTTGR